MEESRCHAPLSALCKMPVMKVSWLASFICRLLAATSINDDQTDAQTSQVLCFASLAQAASTHPVQPPDLRVCSRTGMQHPTHKCMICTSVTLRLFMNAANIELVILPSTQPKVGTGLGYSVG